MTKETPVGGEPQRRPLAGKTLRIGLWTAAALGVAGVLYVTGGAMFKPAETVRGGVGEAGRSWSLLSSADAQAAAQASLHEIPPLTPRGKGQPAPPTPFRDAAGKPVSLTAFRGRVVFLNLWATWCAPCKKEMPTLAAFQKAQGPKGAQVVAVSVDSEAATAQAKAFIAANAPLAFYQDPTLALPFALKPPVGGFPTTIIFDKAGRERARVASDVDWTSDRVRRIAQKLSAE